MKIYCNIGKKRTVRQFLLEGFRYQRRGVNGKFTMTYSDPELNEIQCDIARRSFNDLSSIIKTQYPRYTDNKVAKVLVKMAARGELACIYCPPTRKWVFYKEDRFNWNFETESPKRGNKAKDYVDSSGISPALLLEMSKL